jgi:alkylhydroperoxidase family enzyme
MLAWIVERLLRKQERQLGEPLGYLRKLYRLSPAGFWKFGAIGPLAHHRRAAPATPYFVARLTAARLGGCAECMSTVAGLARTEGVSEALIEAALHRPEALPPDLALVSRFTEAVVKDAPDVASLRAASAQQLGERALVDLAFGIIVGQAFPILKRALGREVESPAGDKVSGAAALSPEARERHA